MGLILGIFVALFVMCIISVIDGAKQRGDKSQSTAYRVFFGIAGIIPLVILIILIIANWH